MKRATEGGSMSWWNLVSVRTECFEECAPELPE